MPVTILVVITAKKMTSNEATFRLSINIIRWILISYGLLTLLYYLTEIFIASYSGVEYLQWQVRATGSYWFAFWIMLLSNTIIPLVLTVRKFKHNLNILIAVSILMNMGWMYELFVIHITNAHREYVTDGKGFQYWNEISVLLSGIVVGAIITIAANLFINIKAKENHFLRL